MKQLISVVKWLLILVVLIAIGGYIYIQKNSNKKFSASFPPIKASKDSAIIARGKYLAYGPAHCVTCHVPLDKVEAVENGAEMPLSGGWEITLGPMGTFRASNLTSDPETGIGNLTDGELARTLRNSIGSDGRLIFPLMPFQEMSDEDLTAVISFIRSQPPIKNKVAPTEFGPVTKALIALDMFKPKEPVNEPPVSVKRDSTAAYGRYLAYNVGNCMTCHTQFDKNSGKFIGADFAGGNLFEPDAFSKGFAFMSPNLTPDKETGIMTNWTEEMFVQRFKSGRVHKGSPMPWGAFSKIEEIDSKALYRFFKSLKPVKRKIDQIVFQPGDKLPEQ